MVPFSSLKIFNRQGICKKRESESAASKLPPECHVRVRTLRALIDNYVYLVHRVGSTSCFVIDPSNADVVITGLKGLGPVEEDLELTAILNTHHHWDHIGGNDELVTKFDIPVFCSMTDKERIPKAKIGLIDQQRFTLDGIEIETMTIPGHTKGQIAYYIPSAQIVFVGDTLFSMGCGRLLEGTPAEMDESLLRLVNLPTETRIYFGHEYTEKNGAFARDVEPENAAVLERLRSSRECLARGRSPTPPTIAEELKVNPFLRLECPAIRQGLGLKDASRVQVFTSLRRLRDEF